MCKCSAERHVCIAVSHGAQLGYMQAVDLLLHQLWLRAFGMFLPFCCCPKMYGLKTLTAVAGLGLCEKRTRIKAFK